MDDKSKIAGFISNHNIIRPIGYPLIAVPFLAASTGVLYLIFYIELTNKHSIESISCIVGIIISIISFVFWMRLRKIYFRRFDVEPGKSMYAAEIWQYVGIIIQTFFLNIYVASWEERLINVIISITFILVAIALTIIATIKVVKNRIKKGVYLKNKESGRKTMMYLSSGVCVVIIMGIKAITVHGSVTYDFFAYFSMLLLISEISTVLAVEYCLKLKYAKEYGLEEYLPTRPYPSKYTGWK